MASTAEERRAKMLARRQNQPAPTVAANVFDPEATVAAVVREVPTLMVNVPAARPSAPEPAASSKASMLRNPAIWLIGGGGCLAIVAVLLALAIFIFFAVVYPRIGYQKKETSYTVQLETCAAGAKELSDDKIFARSADGQQLPVSKIFSPEAIERYRAGEGLKLSLTNLCLASPRGEATEIVIKPWDYPYQTDGPARRVYVVSQESKFKKTLATLRGYVPSRSVYQIFIDDTDGVSDSMRKMARDRINEMKITELVKKGDGATVFVYALSNTSSVAERKKIEIALGHTPEQAAQFEAELDAALEGLLKDPKAKPQSSLVDGFFAALADSADEKAGPNRIIVVSDGVHNTSAMPAKTFASLAANSEKFGELDAFVEKSVQLPSLKEARISWFAPPHPAGKDQVIKDSLNYWQHLLRDKCGATVQVTH